MISSCNERREGEGSAQVVLGFHKLKLNLFSTHTLWVHSEEGGAEFLCPGSIHLFSALHSQLYILCDVSVSNSGELWSQKGISICQSQGMGASSLSANQRPSSLTSGQLEASVKAVEFVFGFHCRPVTFIVSPLTSQYLA